MHIDININWERTFWFIVAMLAGIVTNIIVKLITGYDLSTSLCMGYIFYLSWTKEDK